MAPKPDILRELINKLITANIVDANDIRLDATPKGKGVIVVSTGDDRWPQITITERTGGASIRCSDGTVQSDELYAPNCADKCCAFVAGFLSRSMH